MKYLNKKTPSMSLVNITLHLGSMLSYMFTGTTHAAAFKNVLRS